MMAPRLGKAAMTSAAMATSSGSMAPEWASSQWSWANSAPARWTSQTLLEGEDGEDLGDGGAAVFLVAPEIV